MIQLGGSLKSSSGSSGRATTDNHQVTVHRSPIVLPLHTDRDSPVQDVTAAQVRCVVVAVDSDSPGILLAKVTFTLIL